MILGMTLRPRALAALQIAEPAAKALAAQALHAEAEAGRAAIDAAGEIAEPAGLPEIGRAHV
jgi:hypothetical protein